MAISKIITSSLTDDAVTSAKIGTDQVGADALSSSAISGAVDIPANSVGESELSVDYTAQSVPHIVPGVLYPAVGGKGIDGTTTITSFGTDVTISGFPTLKYYYTDIKGSKPIKDPRIGTYFGSQRHKFKSLQLLEQETATHGVNVYSIDGREWIRACGDKWVALHNTAGTFVENSTASITTDDHFIEIVGYFNDANFLQWLSGTANDIFGVAVNGGTRQSNDFAISVASPLASRYVDPASLLNLTFNATPTLGINTLRISNTNGAYVSTCGVELIAHDTASTARKNEIKIPKQNVVSFGKKFEVGSDDLDNAVHPHYDPFSAKTDGSAWTSPTSGNNTANSAASWPTNIDTAHSLGLENWVNGSSYYRPYNGGRVVKYVDSTGTIKTAVTVMPPNARSIGNANNLSGGEEKGDDSAGNTSAAVANDNFRPTFTDQTIATAEELHEVAKTFHHREFGNGGANEGQGGANYADASMLNGQDNIAYVMDDGLTSLAGDNVYNNGSARESMRWWNSANTDAWYVIFIGTGFTYEGNPNMARDADHHTHLCQNLPYGTHIIEVLRTGTNIGTLKVDGVVLHTTVSNTDDELTGIRECSIHQPKRPPIPEDACVLADYMLMADFVPIGASGEDKISKGVRLNSVSRDFFANTSDSTLAMAQDLGGSFITGYKLYTNSSNANALTARLPSFGTNFVVRGYNVEERCDLYVGSTDSAQTDADGAGSYAYLSSNVTLGVNDFLHKNNASQNGVFGHYEIATPIHTSSHYQSFETPFLHELVGGDRNMEQTNLVVSPDGKTWDQITRDMSYIGGLGINTDVSANQETIQDLLFTEWRGTVQGAKFYNKGFAIAYNRVICLKAGRYRMFYSTHGDSAANSGWSEIRVNGKEVVSYYTWGSNYTNPVGECVVDLVRGDFVQVYGTAKADVNNQSIFNIEQV